MRVLGGMLLNHLNHGQQVKKVVATQTGYFVLPNSHVGRCEVAIVVMLQARQYDDAQQRTTTRNAKAWPSTSSTRHLTPQPRQLSWSNWSLTVLLFSSA
jgi:hypothetical protein